jgi:transposase
MMLATSSQAHTDPLLRALPFSPMEWNITPPAVQDYVRRLQEQVRQLQHQVDALHGQVGKTSPTSSKPPSSDSPFKKPQRQRGQSTGKRGGRTGHTGTGPTLLAPTEVHLIEPPSCACGHGQVVSLAPYHTHQVIELPPIEMAISHFILQQGVCAGCGQVRKAQVPSAPQAGYGPRLTALIGELSGMHRTSRRLLHDFCRSVLHLPISLGAVQKLIDRTSQALVPHYEAIATLARHATVGSIDETPWYCQNALHWLWTLTTETVSLSLMHPHRSKEAFFALIETWQGILVSDGYGVDQDWVNQRQTCLAHLIRTARGLAEKRDPHLAACGRWALRELQRLCHMAKAPPTGGEWRAWYARWCTLIDRYHACSDEAGRLVRRLQREMASLWVFLVDNGVEPPNHRAERALRFAVMWRKGSNGTTSIKGNRWVERSLSLRHTCRQLGQSTFGVLVEAVTSLFHGRQPALTWLH